MCLNRESHSGFRNKVVEAQVSLYSLANPTNWKELQFASDVLDMMCKGKFETISPESKELLAQELRKLGVSSWFKWWRLRVQHSIQHFSHSRVQEAQSHLGGFISGKLGNLWTMNPIWICYCVDDKQVYIKPAVPVGSPLDHLVLPIPPIVGALSRWEWKV